MREVKEIDPRNEKLCLRCGVLYVRRHKMSQGQWNKYRYCGSSCAGKYERTEKHKKIISEASQGKILSDVHKKHIAEGVRGTRWSLGAKEKFSLSKLGEKNSQWKGGGAWYPTIHQWVSKRLGKPTTCEHCKYSGLKSYHIHWANKSGEYRRDLSDWLRLCVPCHRKYDARNFSFARG